jgi:predicted NBD/HSP70 family sugar kinase
MGDPFTGENPAEGGDEKAAKAVKERAVETAAVVIGFVAGLCDPHTIAVGGGVWLQNAWFREQVLRRLSAVLGNQTSGLAVPHVVTARLGDRAGLVGAGYLGLEAGQAR